MNKYLVITVDTEEDYAFQSNHNHETSVLNLKGIPRFQRVCEDYGLIPTYLCTYQVAESDLSNDILLPTLLDKRCEIGAHLHPWLTPPKLEKTAGRNFVSSDYPDNVLRDKFKNLHSAISNRFGMEPTSFRSGRWVMNPYQLALLKEYGYVVDTSVLPFVDYSHIGENHCPTSDYRDVSAKPYYFVEPHTYPNESARGIMEIPVTCYLFSRGLSLKHLEWLKTHIPKFENILCWRTLKMGIVSFQLPCLANDQERLQLMIKKITRKGVNVLNFAIHSNELSAGFHPDFMDPEQIDSLYQNLTSIFQYIHSNGFRGISLSEMSKLV